MFLDKKLPKTDGLFILSMRVKSFEVLYKKYYTKFYISFVIHINLSSTVNRENILVELLHNNGQDLISYSVRRDRYTGNI